MVLGFGQAKGASPTRPADVATLIAKKDYARAIQLIKRQLETQRHDSRLRLQLGDLLHLAGKTKEAVAILTPLADEFAREGFAAKAISVFKKIQKIDPSQRDVDAKLATLIQDKQRVATVPPPPAAAMVEFGMEEIGFEPEPASARQAEPEIEPEPPPPPVEVASPPAAPPERVAPRAPLPAPVEDHDLIDETAEDELPLESLPDIALDADAELPMAEEPALSIEPELELQAEPDIQLEPEIEPEPSAEPMTESLFAEELMSLVDGAFNDPGAPAAAPAAPAGESAGNQIVVSPLFKDFSVDELVAVIHGLNLITFEAGDIILTEGDPGDSMYMLTAGTVKAVKRNAAGRQVAVSQLSEGAFFGEISILTGQPRSATVVATSHCELLEMDRPTLDSIVATHPHVRQVLEQFSKERLANQPRR
jgi:cyclic nucleotide-binding protein/tetratricopeptide repeat protein